MVESYLCTSCGSTYLYDYRGGLGTTFNFIPGSSDSRSFYSAQVSGSYATDTVCVSSNSGSCTPNFSFFMITSQIGIPNVVSGVIGLGTGLSSTYAPNLITTL